MNSYKHRHSRESGNPVKRRRRGIDLFAAQTRRLDLRLRGDDKAFTLIEMAIVLAIIGLVIGSIAVGQSLVRAAQLRNVVSEYDIYLKAIKEFQDKYFALPGDMNNATTIWPTAATANGDGNGTIGTCATASTPADLPTPTGGIGGAGEWFLTWQHLALAGFIPGTYPGTGTTVATAGTNVPASKLPGAGWALFYYLNNAGNVGLWSDQYGHLLAFGGSGSNYANGQTINGILTPAEALGLDQKLDDGMPGTGKVRAWEPTVTGMSNCTVTNTSQTAQTYNVTNSSPACALVFLLGF